MVQEFQFLKIEVFMTHAPAAQYILACAVSINDHLVPMQQLNTGQGMRVLTSDDLQRTILAINVGPR